MMKRKKRIKIILIILICLFILFLIALFVNKNKQQENLISSIVNQEVISSKKFMKYVDMISGNYYMQYKTQIKNEQDDLIECTVEICVRENDISVISPEQNLSIVEKENKIYYIRHDTKSIIIYNMNLANQLKLDSYKLSMSKQEVDNSFITTGMERIKDQKYYYEEYNANDGANTKLRYYFEQDELKYIKKITTDGTETLAEILDIRNKAYDTLFDIPSDYTSTDYSDININL